MLIAFAIASVGIASRASAQLTTSANLQAAARFAADQGICTGQSQTDADCAKVAYTCDGNKWESFVSNHVEFRAGRVSKLNENGVTIPQEVVNFLNANPDNQKRIPSFSVGQCYCLCGGAKDTAPPCGGVAENTPIRVSPAEYFTKEECTALCGTRPVAPKCAGVMQPAEYTISGVAGGTPTNTDAAKAAALQQSCFTKDDCGRQGGVWESNTECRDGKGKCYASATNITLNVPIGKVTQIKGFNEYVVTIYSYLLSILVVATTIMFIYGAFRYLIGSTPLGGIQRGKQIMIDAVIGMFLVLSATMILRTINPALTNLNPLKVYLVNTVQSITSIYCSDISKGVNLADAGETGKVVSRDEVEKMKGAYSISPDAATCGHSYYIEGTTGNPCEGTVCKTKGTACVSCVNAEYSECKGISGPQKTCARLEFGGNIHFDNERYPNDIYLVLACGAAKNPGNLSVIQSNLNVKQKATLKKGSNAGSSDASKTGVATYHIDLSDVELQTWSQHCGSGNFPGGFLAVEYNGGTGVLTPAKCVGGGGKLSGYANGSDIAKAFQCAITAPNTDFENPSTAYWSFDNLKQAAAGDSPIVCNFNLDDTSAPGDPESKPGYCKAAGGTTATAPSTTSACDSGTTTGSTCYIDKAKCTQANGKACTCSVISLSGSGAFNATPMGSWSCE